MSTAQSTPQSNSHESRPAPLGAPPVVDREAWLRERRELLAREKAHTHEGDAIAAARRRLPMTEVDADVAVVGPHGPTPLRDVFEGHDELVVYKHMWHEGEPFENQCEGCTLSYWAMRDASYLRARGVAFAAFAQGPWDEVEPFVRFMGYSEPWYSVHGVDDPAVAGEFGTVACFLRQGDRVFLTYETTGRGVEAIMPSLLLLDMTVRGREEAWQDSPDGWPEGKAAGWFWRAHADGVGNAWTGGRPTAQWSRPGATPVAGDGHHHH